MKNNVNLKPCPFCNGSNVLVSLHPDKGSKGSIWSIDCHDCDATFPNHCELELLIAAWNRRPNTVESPRNNNNKKMTNNIFHKDNLKDMIPAMIKRSDELSGSAEWFDGSNLETESAVDNEQKMILAVFAEFRKQYGSGVRQYYGL